MLLASISSYNDTTIITGQRDIARKKGGGSLNKKQIERWKENDRRRKVEVLVRVVLRSSSFPRPYALLRF